LRPTTGGGAGRRADNRGVVRIASVALSLALVACNTSGLPSGRSTPPTTTPTRAAARTPTPTAVTDRVFADALIASGLPVANVRVLNAETDPNALLGKPDQYVGKVYWSDTRVLAGQPTAELFADDATMAARFAYLDNNFKQTASPAQYMYRNDARRVLLRVPTTLTRAQATEYEEWLKKL
jgi:hypothetical protein